MAFACLQKQNGNTPPSVVTLRKKTPGTGAGIGRPKSRPLALPTTQKGRPSADTGWLAANRRGAGRPTAAQSSGGSGWREGSNDKPPCKRSLGWRVGMVEDSGFILTTPITTKLDVFPVSRPFFSPGKRAATDDASLGW